MQQNEAATMKQTKKTGEITGGKYEKNYEKTKDQPNKEDKKPRARDSLSKREKWIETITRLIDFF